jgi:anionic cell wall polymer biosynthesis LytR-Cps2A-Psr (LCP) family protein
MRTTLKRGVGRGATSNGSNRATVPPGPLGPVTVYRQPPPPPRRRGSLVLQIFGWAALVLCVLVGGTAGGAYLYLHESVAAVAPRSKEVKEALKSLDVALPGQPAIALVIGYDHRADESKTTPSRSDTLMLVRADPDTKAISLLSFPRDLSAEIDCPAHAPFVS